MAHSVVWLDIPVVDLDRAIRFYSAVLGSPVTKQEALGMKFGLFTHGDGDVGGCLVMRSDNAPSTRGPLVYLNAAGRLDSAIAAIEPHGGKILEPKHSIGPHGYRVIVQDSEGNRVALHSP